MPAAFQDLLGERWYPLEPHRFQHQYWQDKRRFKLNHSGRRSGKTELVKREGVMLACTDARKFSPQYIFAAPTLKQARKIWWTDLKELVPRKLVAAISETYPSITLVTGTVIRVEGLDKPERIEGSPIDWIAIDEASGIKPGFWGTNIRPALATRGREGVARLLGVPRGRGYYYDLYQMARDSQEWSIWRWDSDTVVSAAEMASMMGGLDSRTKKQELRGEFLSAEGKAYYEYREEIHDQEVPYIPYETLDISFDFNVTPGVATISQYVYKEDLPGFIIGAYTFRDRVLTMLDEVWIEEDSNTTKVLNALYPKIQHHRGMFRLYGDAAGGARHTSQTDGSDWDLITAFFNRHFHGRFSLHVPAANPAVIGRLNSVNVMFVNALDQVGTLIHPRCEWFKKDLDGTMRLPNGELDKKTDPDRTHITDAWGYRVWQEAGFDRADFEDAVEDYHGVF